MKKTVLTLGLALLMSIPTFSQGYYTQYYADKTLTAKAKAKFYLSSPKEFFLFFPSDWHIAKINNGLKNLETGEDIRVVAVKIDYVD